MWTAILYYVVIVGGTAATYYILKISKFLSKMKSSYCWSIISNLLNLTWNRYENCDTFKIQPFAFKTGHSMSSDPIKVLEGDSFTLDQLPYILLNTLTLPLVWHLGLYSLTLDPMISIANISWYTINKGNWYSITVIEAISTPFFMKSSPLVTLTGKAGAW